MGRVGKLLSNTAIFGAGTFISKVLVFLLMPFYTAYLSNAEFGVADILVQTSNLIIPLAVLGISDGLFRFTLDADSARRKQIFTSAILVLVIGVLPLALVIQALRGFDVYDGYVWLVFAYICSANLHMIVANYIRGCDKTKAYAVQGIVNTVLVISFNVLFLLVFDMGVMGYVLSVVLADFLVAVGLIIFFKLYKDVKLREVNKPLMKDLLRFSIPYIPLTLMWTITSASDRFVILAVMGDDAVSVNGLYAAAYKLPTLITIAGGIFIKAWQMSSVGEKDPKERASFFSMVYKNYLGIVFMGSACLIALAKVFTMLLLNESYYSSWVYVPMLVLAMAFSAFSEFLGSVYFVHKKSGRSLITASAGAIANIALNFALIPFLGAVGAAIATVICYAIVFFIRLFDTQKFIKFERSFIKTILNVLLIVAQVILMTLELPYWWIYQIVIVSFVIIFNGKDVFSAVKSLLKGKSKKAEKI